MKTKEFIFEIKKPRVKMPKQRDPNWQTMQAKATSGAGGQHRDEKRAEKLGDVKHKQKQFEQGVAEVTGDKPFDSMMKDIKKGTKKQATTDRREREAASREQARNAFGPSPADRLSIRSDKGVREGSDWGEPREILEDVLQTLEREVEWPLSEVMDPREFRPLLSALVRAVNDKLLSMDRDGNQ
jgi:hypothetical protein